VNAAATALGNAGTWARGSRYPNATADQPVALMRPTRSTTMGFGHAEISAAVCTNTPSRATLVPSRAGRIDSLAAAFRCTNNPTAITGTAAAATCGASN